MCRLLLIMLTTLLPTATGALGLIDGTAGNRLRGEVIASIGSPWAMTFVAPQRLLVTAKTGVVWLVSTDGQKIKVAGVPVAMVGGQGGMGDVVPHPDYATNKWIYLSYVESNDGGKTRGAAVVRGRLRDLESPVLTDVERLWTQSPKMAGNGHFAHRIVFGPKGGRHAGKIFITSGDRQAQNPAQGWDNSLGKVIRLHDDGRVPFDNPFQGRGALARSFWTLGHRNSLGIAFDGAGRLWAHEMGPAHGDELNLIEAGRNYGWPLVSEGNHYSGLPIPSHKTRPDFAAPRAFWVPTIAPSGLVIYSGKLFPSWAGAAFIGGLRSRALIRVTLRDDQAREAERFRWKRRVREVEEGPDGALWILEDGPRGRLIRFSPP